MCSRNIFPFLAKKRHMFLTDFGITIEQSRIYIQSDPHLTASSGERIFASIGVSLNRGKISLISHNGEVFPAVKWGCWYVGGR